MEIRKANIEDKEQILALYRKVTILPDGIIRNPDEIDESYILQFLKASIDKGLILVGLIEGEIIAEIHAITPNIFAFQHLMTDLTIVVDPSLQGKGIGKRIFKQFLTIIETDFPNILRLELFTREHNERNVKFYESLGFMNEGRQERKIYLSKNNFHTPIHMAWFNANYDCK
jgi:putative acetyltransferase